QQADQDAAKANQEAEQEAQQEAADASADAAATAHAQAASTGIQAGLDAAALALSFLMGLDPGLTPCFGMLLFGMPNVLIGGFPMPRGWAVAKGLGRLGRGLKRGPKKLGQFLAPGKRVAHPIGPVTGANQDEFLDYEAHEPIAFRWERNYTSADAGRE